MEVAVALSLFLFVVLVGLVGLGRKEETFAAFWLGGGPNLHGGPNIKVYNFIHIIGCLQNCFGPGPKLHGSAAQDFKGPKVAPGAKVRTMTLFIRF